MSIDKYDVLRYAETLSEEDLQLLLEQLILIKNFKYPVVLPRTEMVDAVLTKNQLREIPPYHPRPLRSVKDVVDSIDTIPPFVPAPPVMVWKDCTCSKFWSMVCKCDGGRFVPEDEL